MQKTSLCYWYPKIKNFLPTPRTGIVPLIDGDIDQLFGALDGKKPSQEFIDRIVAGADTFEFPLFLRTDFTSGKHDFRRTCYVKDREHIVSNAIALFEDTLCKDIDITAFVFREFLHLDSGFKAFDGLPISRERRYFVEDGEVLCHHPYWPEDAIRGEVVRKGDGWKETLKDLNTETVGEITFLSELAKRFSLLVDGAWSVDFAKLKNDTRPYDVGRLSDWVLIDAAEAHRSWHPSDCPVAFPEGS